MTDAGDEELTHCHDDHEKDEPHPCPLALAKYGEEGECTCCHECFDDCKRAS